MMIVSNPTSINIVALQQPIETSVLISSTSTIQTEQNSNSQSQINLNDQTRISQNNQISNPLIGTQPRFTVSNISSSISRPNIQPNINQNQMPYINSNQYNSQQYRSTNTPPINNVNNPIISPNNQAANQNNLQGIQGIQTQISNQSTLNVQSSASNRIQPQIRPQCPVQPISNQTQILQSHGMSQMNASSNMNQNLNYYHQSQMPINQMHLYSSVNMAQSGHHMQQQGNQQISGQTQTQPPSQFNTNVNMIQQQIAQPINFQGQLQTGQQLQPPPQYPNNIHPQVQSQIPGQILYNQHSQQQNIPIYNQQGQSQQMIMMQQQQFGNMYQQIQSNQSQIQNQSNQIISNQFVNQQNTQQQPHINSPQSKVEKKSKEEKQKKKSKKTTLNE